MSNTGWKDLQSAKFPWISSFNKIVKSAMPPLIDGETMIISSDYSGDSSKSKYVVLSILLIDLIDAQDWEFQRRLIREKWLVNNRKMSFKGLNDAFKKNALFDFLDASNLLKGISVNIVIDKQIKDLIGSDILYQILQKRGKLKRQWHLETFAKMSQLAFFISLLIAGLAKPDQNIYWYSDEDNMFSNINFSSDVGTLMDHFVTYNVNFKLGECGIGTTKLNEPDFFEEDLNSISDLTAGALSEFFERVHPLLYNNRLKDITYIAPTNLSSKTALILDWLEYSNEQLKKIVIVFDKLDNGFKIWRFNTKEDPRPPFLLL